MRSLKGRLLVANPAMPDPNFSRTVVLVLAHHADGAFGVVLNRPSDLDVDSPLPRWEKLVADPRVVFVGGPVAPGAAICLARVPHPPPQSRPASPRRPDLRDPDLRDPDLRDPDGTDPDGTDPDGRDLDGSDPDGLGGWMPLVGDLGTLDLDRDPADLAIGVEAIRVFAGYAGWGPDQLEGELAAGAWFVVDAESGDALAEDPGQLWRRVLRRQGGRLALVASYPADPSLN